MIKNLQDEQKNGGHFFSNMSFAMCPIFIKDKSQMPLSNSHIWILIWWAVNTKQSIYKWE